MNEPKSEGTGVPLDEGSISLRRFRPTLADRVQRAKAAQITLRFCYRFL
jgi:hypothetical protein